MYQYPANPLYERTAQEEWNLHQQFWQLRSDAELLETSGVGSCKDEEDRAAIVRELARRLIDPTASGIGWSTRLGQYGEGVARTSAGALFWIRLDVLVFVFVAIALILPLAYFVFIGQTTQAIGYAVFGGLCFASSSLWSRYVTDRCGSCGRPAAMELFDTLSLGFWSNQKFRYKCKCCGDTSGWERERGPSD
jgi:hypothetical protein